ncbi:hypothetical protein [Leptolyngbya sp. FACHB-16]|uniref:hypothetical protein n=1 Tax=unclassified Leptolyngbya TaxID=2650499 RepID=UPI001684ED66|nr:hypothetical protein [Leptolyngbya sp. FACHB-16]MBD2156285.1 hypothetical protein [Leptolyngbya sp. FACHB-16]
MSSEHQQQAKEQLFQAILLWGEAHGYRWNSKQLLVISSNTEAYLELLAGSVGCHPSFWNNQTSELLQEGES